MRSQLSAREKEVLALAVKGFTDDMIANHIGIGKGTVNSYWVRIRSKLGNYSRTELAARFVQARADEFQSAELDRRDAEALEGKYRLDAAALEIKDLLADRENERINRASNEDLLKKAHLEIERLKKLVEEKSSGN